MRRVAGVVLDGPELRIAAALARIAVRHLERTDGTVPPAALDLLRQMETLAAESRSGTLASGSAGRGSESESEFPDTGLGVAVSPMTVQEAARLLGISDQAVTARCRAGSLAAVKARGGWDIDRRSAAALAAARRERDDRAGEAH